MVDVRGDLSPAPSFIPVDGQIHRIVLTAYRGKSTVGLLLADRTRWNFLDLDAYIETITNKNAQELFDALGGPDSVSWRRIFWASGLKRPGDNRIRSSLVR